MPYRKLRYWLLPLMRLRIWTVRGREHLPKRGAFLIASNHSAWVDSPLMVGAIYRRLKKKVYFISRSHHYESLGALHIDPLNKAEIIPLCLEKLEQGHPVVVYPEGSSNPLPVLLPPKTGIARLAHLTGLPVVPVGIRGTFGITMPVSLFCFFSFWRRLSFHFGPALTFPKLPEEALTKELLCSTSRTVMAAIAPLCGKRLLASTP